MVVGIICREIIFFAISGPSASVQTARPEFDVAAVNAASVGAKTVNVLVPEEIIMKNNLMTYSSHPFSLFNLLYIT